MPQNTTPQAAALAANLYHSIARPDFDESFVEWLEDAAK